MTMDWTELTSDWLPVRTLPGATLTSDWLPSRTLPWFGILGTISEAQLTCLAEDRDVTAGQLRALLLEQLTGHDGTYSLWFDGPLWFGLIRPVVTHELKRSWSDLATTVSGDVIEAAIEVVLDGIVAAYEPKDKKSIKLLAPIRKLLRILKSQR